MSPSTLTSAARRRGALRRSLLAPAACVLVLAATAACSAAGDAASAGTSTAASSTSSSAMGSSPVGGSMAATDTALMIEKFAFKTPDSVSPGAKVAIMNMDGEAHTVTADEGAAFDVKAPPGQTVTLTAPTKPGSYAFHCTYHSNMHGVLVVK